MTIFIDDAGTGDILFGVVIGAYRPETDHFVYDVIDVRYFQEPVYGKKRHLNEARRIALRLVERLGLGEDEKIFICTGDILNEAAESLLEQYGEEKVVLGKIEGRGQHLVELAFTNELLNIGYEAMENRTEKWGKNFWHMYNWIKKKPKKRLKWSKSAFPNLKKYPLFQK
ncbi:MAG: hypothetical protein NWE89_06085 [Candidatus Bathyarchaeota archaeon]|nr:hypothetical protein [Candidatus Bathyarchaeota archaeon]